MDSIKLFLARFKDYLPPEIAAKGIIREVIKEKTGIELKSDEVEISKNGTVYIKARPVAKSEIFLKNEAIMEELELRLFGLRHAPKKVI